MKASKLLRLALDKYLWDGIGAVSHPKSSAFLCCAIESAAADSSRGKKYAACSQIQRQSEVLTDYIEVALEGRATLYSWLLSMGHTPEEPRCADMQEHRRQWGERIIKEFKSRGN